MQNEGLALRYASDDLRASKGIVMLAVKNDGHALYYASDTLLNDREVVRAAMQQDPYALSYAGLRMQTDQELRAEQRLLFQRAAAALDQLRDTSSAASFAAANATSAPPLQVTSEQSPPRRERSTMSTRAKGRRRWPPQRASLPLGPGSWLPSISNISPRKPRPSFSAPAASASLVSQ